MVSIEKRSLRIGLLVTLIVTLIFAVEFRGQALQDTWDTVLQLIGLKGEPLPASPARLSEHEIEKLQSLSPQQQAELLLERAINHYEGASELIENHVDSWRGKLKGTQHLNGVLAVALNSNDLRVRAAAVEIYLAMYGYAKNPDSLKQLEQVADSGTPQQRQSAVWVMGLLANRGIQPERVEEVLSTYLHDSDEKTRYWAVEGLAFIGSDTSIPVLLGMFHDDPSAQVRERAACGLAQSGMLTHDQRQKAVPQLLNFTDDPQLDLQTRGWVFQALHDITGKNLPNDPAPWRNWYSSQAH
jgi:hypothetical protein